MSDTRWTVRKGSKKDDEQIFDKKLDTGEGKKK